MKLDQVRRFDIFVLFLLFLGCGVGVKMKGHAVDGEGLYRCISPIPSIPVYSFDSRHETSVVWLGDDQGLEFVDIATGENVRLHNDNFNYECSFAGEESEDVE